MCQSKIKQLRFSTARTFGEGAVFILCMSDLAAEAIRVQSFRAPRGTQREESVHEIWSYPQMKSSLSRRRDEQQICDLWQLRNNPISASEG
jgi:hypothetical protein